MSRPFVRSAARLLAFLATVLPCRAGGETPEDPIEARILALADDGIPGNATRCVNEFFGTWRPAEWREALERAERDADAQKSWLASVLLVCGLDAPLSPERLSAAVRGLAERDISAIPKRCVEALALRPRDPAERDAIRSALADAVRSEDGQTRRLAALCLAWDASRPFDSELLEPLLENLRRDRVPGNGLRAVTVLARLREPAVRDRLLVATDDPDRQTARLAALALLESGTPVDGRILERALGNLIGPGQGAGARAERTEAALLLLPFEELIGPLEKALAEAPIVSGIDPAAESDASGEDGLGTRAEAEEGEGDDSSPGFVFGAEPGLERGSRFEGDLLRRRIARILFSFEQYRISPAMLEFLGRELESDDVRWNADEAMERLSARRDEPEVREFLIANLSSPDSQRARLSRWMVPDEILLGRAAGPAARLHVAMLECDEFESFRKSYSSDATSAARFLLENPEHATPELEAALDSTRPGQAWLAAFVLGSTGRGNRAERIAEILSHPERVELPSDRGRFEGRSASVLHTPENHEGDPFAAFRIVRGLAGLGAERLPEIRAARETCHPPARPLLDLVVDHLEHPGVDPFRLETAIRMRDAAREAGREWLDERSDGGALQPIGFVHPMPVDVLSGCVVALERFDEWYHFRTHWVFMAWLPRVESLRERMAAAGWIEASSESGEDEAEFAEP